MAPESAAVAVAGSADELVRPMSPRSLKDVNTLTSNTLTSNTLTSNTLTSSCTKLISYHHIR